VSAQTLASSAVATGLMRLGMLMSPVLRVARDSQEILGTRLQQRQRRIAHKRITLTRQGARFS